MRQAHVSYLNALWYFSFLLCLSSNTHLKQPERMGREQKVLWFFFFLILMPSISIFTNGKLKPAASRAPLKHLKVTVRKGKLGNSGHGRTPVLLVHHCFCGWLHVFAL